MRKNMFFNNILLYRLLEPFAFSSEEFNEKLSQHSLLPCPRSEAFSVGWVSPYGPSYELLVHALKDYMLFAFCKEEKIIPSPVIQEALQRKIMEFEQREGRAIYRKEKFDLKEQVILDLRNQAFTRKKTTFAYIDTKLNMLLINTASRNKAEELCSYLRKSLGSLKLALPVTRNEPGAIMTTWLIEKQQPTSFNIENNCDMLDIKSKVGMIKCKEQDLISDEIIQLLSEKQIIKLALTWLHKISFEFCEDLAIKKLRFLDLICDGDNSAKSQTKQEQLDRDFAIMSGELSQLMRDLWVLFDGLAPIAT
jgi:recombination associated protein RdgC